MNDPGFFLCLGLGFFAIPIVALIVALTAKSRLHELGSHVERLAEDVAALRDTLEKQAIGLRVVERRLKEVAEGAPARLTPETPVPHIAVPPPAGAGTAPAPVAAPILEKPPAPPARAVAESVVRPAAKPVSPAFPAAPPLKPAVAATKPPALAVPAGVTPSTTPPAASPASPAAPPPTGPLAASAPPTPSAPSPEENWIPERLPATASPKPQAPPSVAPAPRPPVPPVECAPSTLRGSVAPGQPDAPAAPAGRAVSAPPRLSPDTPPPPSKKGEKGGWERRLGIVVPVWFGAIALTLGGAYLVKYTIEHSLISPQMRVVLGILLGVALLVTGELLRKRTAMTAQGASASGVAVLYAALLAATVLYKPPMIPPLVGFGLIALVTALAVALSLRQGIVVAFVGLVGGFFTPYFIGAVSASPGRLFTYMLLLQGGLLVVTRKRQWTGLSALTLLMGLSAALHRLAIPAAIGDAPFIGLFLLFSAGSFVWAAKTWRDTSTISAGTLGEVPKSLILGYVSLVTSFLALAGLAIKTRFGLTEWAFLGVLSLGTLALGRLDKHYSRLPWVALVLTGTLLGGWIAASAPTDRSSIWIVAAGFGLLWGFGGWVCHHRSASPETWATLSVLGGLGSFGAACAADYLHGKSFEHWGYLSAGMAVLYLLAAIPAALPARRREYGEANLAAFCVAVSSFLSFAVPLELERQWLTVAWALETAALAWLLSHLRVRALGAIGIVLAAGVALRLLLNPSVLTYPVGTTPVLNWILYGYGLPVLAFALAAIWYERSGWARTGSALWWGSGALAFYLATLEVRQGFHPGSLVGPAPGLLEWATYSHAWMALALLLLLASRRWQKPVFAHMALVFVGCSVLKIVVFDLLEANPLWAPAELGPWPALNWLLYVYGVPTVAFALAARWLDREGWVPLGRFCAWFSALSGFVLLSLEVRQGFHTGGLIAPQPTLVEWATYSHLWVAAGLLLLLAHRRWREEVLGQIGLVYLGLSAAKILVVDLYAANPLWTPADLGPWPVLNWLIYVYAVPTAFFALGATWLGKTEWIQHGRVAAWFSALVGFAFLGLEVRHGFHPGGVIGPRPELVEWATYSHLWLVVGIGLLAAHSRWGRPLLRDLGVAFLLVSAVKILCVDLVAANPLWAPSPLGSWPVLNWLLYTNGLPAAGFALAAWMLGQSAGEKAGKSAAWFSALLAFAFLSFEVRHGFHGGAMSASRPSLLEWSTYSHVWLVAGLLLLAGYQSWKKPLLRDLALVFAVLAAVKILIFDLLFSNPLWVETSLGAWPVLNWLVYSYALPVALFAYLGWWLSEEPGGESAGRAAVWFSAALAFVFLLLEVRQGFHPVRLPGPAPSLVEWATYSHVWMAAGLLLLAAFRKWPREMLSQTGTAFVAFAAVKAIVVELVLANPLWNHSAVGTLPVLNWLLYVYGLPFLGLWALRALTRDLPGEAGGLASAAHILQLVLFWALVSLEVRQFFHPRYLDADAFGLLESATYGHLWLFLAGGLLLAWRRWEHAVDLHAARWLVVAAAAKIVLVDLAFRNPLGWPEDLGGTPVLNGLLFVYAIPIALFWFLNRMTDHPPWRQITHPLAAHGNLLLAIVLLTLEVRQYFHRNFLNEGPLTNAENYAYSAAWILFALCLLVTGIYRRGKFLRIASLVVMLLAVVKVFLYDLRHLHDLYRVMSLLGLGASLLFISYLFSRFVLRDESNSLTAEEES